MLLLDDVKFAGKVIERPGQGYFKARFVTAPLRCVDIIHKGIDEFRIAIVILHGNVKIISAFFFQRKGDCVFMDDIFVFV